MSAGRNLMKWKSRRRDVPERLEPSLSDEASAEEEGLDRFHYENIAAAIRMMKMAMARIASNDSLFFFLRFGSWLLGT